MDVDALDSVITGLDRLVDELQGEQAPALDELIALGTKLPSIVYALAYAAQGLRDQILDLPNRYELTDNREREPEESLIESADVVRSLATLMERAYPAASDYYEHVQYLAVARELAPGEEPVHEIRTATAADMARRTEATTHIDKQPPALMQDTINVTRTRP